MRQSATLFLVVAGVWVSWSVHDYLQERVFRAPGFKFGIFMAFCLQFVSFLLSLSYQLGEWTLERNSAKRRQEEQEEARRQREEALDNEEQERGLLNAIDAVPEDAFPPSKPSSASWSTLLLYLALSLLIAAANGCATAALNYVSMQTKVLFKSSKIVTVMLLGALVFGKSYQPSEYAYMLIVVLGLATFLLAGSRSVSLDSSLTGLALLAGSILSDSFVPNVQQRLLQGAGRPKQEMIFHTNWCSALFTAIYAVTTGEMTAAVVYLGRRPRVLGLLLLQSVAGYVGILVYLETVSRYGSKVTAIVTSCRKLFTIGLSSLAFGHPLTGFHVAGVLAVFIGVLLNASREQRCSKCVALPVLLMLAMMLVLELQLLEGGDQEQGLRSASEFASLVQPVRLALQQRLL